jgi:xylobiose transport system substrate-binding protein
MRTRSSCLVALAAMALAACGSSGPGDAGDKLHVWTLQDEAQNKVQNASIDAFNKTSDVDATLDTFSNSAFPNKLRVAMGSRNAPDVFFNWAGGSIATYADAGQIADLGPFLDRNPKVRDAFLPSVLEAGQLDGTQYGVPMRGMQPVLLYYNKDVFSKVGAQPPRTYDELLALVDRFKAEGITPFALGGADAWTDLMWLEYLTDRVGGQQPFLDLLAGKPGAWENPAITEALTMIRDLIDRGAFGTKYNSVTYDNGAASAVFAKGDAAMHLMGTWEYSNQLTQNKEFAESGLAFTTFPTVAGGKGDPDAVVGNPTNYYSVNQKSKRRKQAMEFLKQTTSPKYLADLIAAGDVPAVKGLEDELAKSPNPEFSADVYEMVQRAPSFTLSWDQAVDPKESAAMITNLKKFFAKQIDVRGFQQAMTAAAS